MSLRATLTLLAVMLYAGTAEAMTLQKPEPVTTGTCALTCSTRQSDDSWKSKTQCFENMTTAQCSALAHHHNLSDAYPARLKCEAKITTPCTATR